MQNYLLLPRSLVTDKWIQTYFIPIFLVNCIHKCRWIGFRALVRLQISVNTNLSPGNIVKKFHSIGYRSWCYGQNVRWTHFYNTNLTAHIFYLIFDIFGCRKDEIKKYLAHLCVRVKWRFLNIRRLKKIWPFANGEMFAGLIASRNTAWSEEQTQTQSLSGLEICELWGFMDCKNWAWAPY